MASPARLAGAQQLPPTRDTWTRSPETAPSDDTRRRYRDFFRHREATNGRLTDEERVYSAIVELGPDAPLEQLAIAAGLAALRTVDSARKRARGLCKRLEVRGLVRPPRKVRLPFAACSHVTTEGKAGRLECERLLREAGITTGCTAHHGHYVRELVPLTPRDRAARLDLPAREVRRRVRERDAAERAAREANGRAANDAEARRLRGEPVARGPRGTNRTSARFLKSVPPIPSESLSMEMEITRSHPGSGGPRSDVSSATTRLTSAEATPTDAAAALTLAGSESTEGKRAPGVPNVASIAEARRTRERVDWFLREWARARLPPLNALERRKVLWVRARVMPLDELELALCAAKRVRAAAGNDRVFARVFADRAKLAEHVHHERGRRLRDAPSLPQAAGIGQPITRGAARSRAAVEDDFIQRQNAMAADFERWRRMNEEGGDS